MTGPKITKALLIVGIGLCLITCLVTYKAYTEMSKAQTWVNHTYEIIQEADIVVEISKEIEIGHLQNTLSPDEALPEKQKANVKRLQSVMLTLRNLTIDNERQTNLIDNELQPLLDLEIRDMNDNRKSREIQKEIDRNGLFDINRIHKPIGQLIQRERELLKTRYDKLAGATSFMIVCIFSSLTLITTLIFIAFVTIGNVKNQNDHLVALLANTNETLEKKVSEQTREIEEKSKNLHTRNNELAAINEELSASEEELKSSLEYISHLKNDLESREKLYRLLAEHSQDMITIVDLDSIIEYTSPACKTIVNYEAEELIGKKGFELVHPEDLASVEERMTAVNLEGTSSAHFQFRMIRKDGSFVWVESQTSPIVDDNGTVIKRQTTIRDVSIQRKAAEEILKAKEKAEEATVAKSQFLSTMSHEIRTPMNAVIGLSHILLQSSPRTDQVENLRLLKFSAENLLVIINDILDFSKIEASKITLEAANFDLHQLLTNSKTTQQKSADEKGIQLHFRLGKNIPNYVVGDPVRLNQVITNLVSNAIKFTEKGLVELSAECISAHGKLSRIEFKVKDSGIGIDKEKLDYIFESFSQANSDTTRKFGGTGLGLAISKRLVEMMGGEIIVESSPGNGSTFRFEVTLEIGVEEQSATQERPTILKIQDAKALVIEDNRVNQIVARNFLNKWGIEVDFANNGFEGLSMVKSKPYHIILMDLQMPEMDGYKAAQEIRLLPGKRFKEVPIIALTASAMVETQDKVFASGMNGFISKPFDPEDFRIKIFSYLNAQSGTPRPVSNAWAETSEFLAQADPDIKEEMTRLIINNIIELQESVKALQSNHDTLTQYKETVHKVKTAIHLLNDQEFKDAVEQLPRAFSNHGSNGTDSIKECVALYTLCQKIIDDLTNKEFV